MKNTFLFCVLLSMFFMPTLAVGQTDDAAQMEVMKKLQQAIENLSKSDDSPLGQIKMPSFSPVELDKVYHFATSYSYSTTMSTNGKRENQMSYDLKIPDAAVPTYLAMETELEGMKGTVVFDHELKSMLALSPGNSGTIISFESINKIGETSSDDELGSDLSLKPTGNNGSHLGFSYEEFEFQSTEAEGVIWVCKDEQINLFKLFMDMGMKGKQNNTSIDMSQFEQIDGLLLKTVVTTKSDGSVTSMELTGVEEVKESKDMSKYQIIDMSGMMGG